MEGLLKAGFTYAQAEEYLIGLQAVAEIDDFEFAESEFGKQQREIELEYDLIFENNYNRKEMARVRHINSKRDKAKRLAKANRKANHNKICNLNNGNIIVSMCNCRGYYTDTIVPKKANHRNRKERLVWEI